MYTYVETSGRDNALITIVCDRELKSKAESCDAETLNKQVTRGAKISSDRCVIPNLWFVGKKALKQPRLVAIIIDIKADAHVVECTEAWMDHDDNGEQVTNIQGSVISKIKPQISQITSENCEVAPRISLWDFVFTWNIPMGNGALVQIKYQRSKFECEVRKDSKYILGVEIVEDNVPEHMWAEATGI